MGYISPDFRRNVLQHFVQPFLTMDDRTRFAVYVYSTAEQPDEVTAGLRPHADQRRGRGGRTAGGSAAPSVVHPTTPRVEAARGR